MYNTIVGTASSASDVGKFLGTHSYTVDDSNYTFKVVRGDYSPLMRMICDNLKQAKVSSEIFNILSDVTL